MVRAVPLQRVVLLVDDSTDIGLLKQTLQAAWASLPADSPNASAGPHEVRLLQVSSGGRMLDVLLALLTEPADAGCCSQDPGSAEYRPHLGLR